MGFDEFLKHLNTQLGLDYSPSLGDLDGEVVLVTGGAGSIGSEIALQSIARNAKKVLVLDNCENSLYRVEQRMTDLQSQSVDLILGDYGDEYLLSKIIKDYRPTVLIHAGAYKHVPLLQYNIYACVMNNIKKARQLFLSLESTVKSVIVVSTDKACNPSNAMGFSKLIVEEMAKIIFSEKARIVRFGNVLGSSGSVALKFYDQALKDKPVTLTDKAMKRYFMSISQASQLVLNALTLPSGTYILEMGGQVAVEDLAKATIAILHSSSPIVETGIRCGEKLEEELYSASGKLVKVSPKIYEVVEAEKENHPFLDLEIKSPELVVDYLKLEEEMILAFGESNDRF